MAGRWKVGNGGQAEWEEGTTAPNQIAPPPGATQQNTGSQSSGGATPDYAPSNGNTGVSGGAQAPSDPWALKTDPSNPSGFPWTQIDPSKMIRPTGPEWQWSPSNPDGRGGPNVSQFYGAPLEAPEQPSAQAPSSLEQTMLDKYDYEQQNNTGVSTQVPGGTTTTPAATPPAGTAPSPPTINNGLQAMPAGSAPLGFDQAKWSDPAQGSSKKYQVGRILAGGGSIQDAAAAVGAKVLSPDKIQYPDGFIADVFFDYGGPQQRVQYTDVTGESGGGGQATGQGGPVGGGVPGGALGFGNGNTGVSGYGGGNFGGFGSTNGGASIGQGVSTSSSGAFSNPRASGLYDMLMGRATQGLGVNSRDPIIANQVDSFRAEQKRGANDAIDAQAEAQGPYGNLTSERRLANEHAAQATGGMQAQLMGQELTAKRAEIQNALSQMGGMLNSEQGLALQRDLGMIDAALRQQGITNQNNQFLDDYSLRNTQQANWWDAQRRGTL